MDDKFNISDKEHRNLFKLPENYFDKLPFEIKSQVQNKNNTSVHFPLFKWGVSLASIAICVVTFLLFQPTSPANTDFDTISSTEAYHYLHQNDLLEEEYLIENLVANNTAINTAIFYLNNSTLNQNDTELLNEINIDYLDLEDYEMEY